MILLHTPLGVTRSRNGVSPVEKMPHVPNRLIAEIEEVIEFAGRVPRWSFFATVGLIGVLLSVLFHNLKIGPWWIGLVLIGVLLIPMYITILRGHHLWTRRLGIGVTTMATIGVVLSVIFLVYAMFQNTESALRMFRDAALLWSTNVLLFAIWYWEVDQGGPLRRHANIPQPPDLLFPQLAVNAAEWEQWKPAFIDYLFLAFNTSTAFSPTDTLAMSKRAKVLMMAQSSISLVTIAVLAARAINIA